MQLFSGKTLSQNASRDFTRSSGQKSMNTVDEMVGLKTDEIFRLQQRMDGMEPKKSVERPISGWGDRETSAGVQLTTLKTVGGNNGRPSNNR